MNARTPNSPQTAFTLIEMIVVLTIIWTLSGAAIVAIVGRQRECAFRLAAEELAVSIRSAMRQAAATGDDHRIVMDPDRRAYRLERLETKLGAYRPGDGPTGTWRKLPVGTKVRPETFDGRELVEDQSLVFGPSGDGFAGALRIEDVDGRWCRIEVLPRTGQVDLAMP